MSHVPDNRLTGGGEAVCLTRLPPFTSSKILGTHLCKRPSLPQSHSAAGRIRWIGKKNLMTSSGFESATIRLVANIRFRENPFAPSHTASRPALKGPSSLLYSADQWLSNFVAPNPVHSFFYKMRARYRGEARLLRNTDWPRPSIPSLRLAIINPRCSVSLNNPALNRCFKPLPVVSCSLY
jgi:hypothetical protein